MASKRILWSKPNRFTVSLECPLLKVERICMITRIPKKRKIMSDKNEIRFIPNPDHTAEKDAQMRKCYGDCYGCKHHFESGWLCLKTQCPLHYPIHECCGREEGWA